MVVHTVWENDTIADVKLRYIRLFLILSLFLLPSAIFAQSELADQQSPAQRCVLSQNYLKNIQKSRDLRARVDRLQAYRYIYQRLDIFVIRLEKNNQPDAVELRNILDDFAQTTEEFKDNYEQYDVARDNVAAMKSCADNLEDFQEKLSKAREERQKVSENVRHIHDILSIDTLRQLEDLHAQLSEDKKQDVENE